MEQAADSFTLREFLSVWQARQEAQQAIVQPSKLVRW